MTAKGIATKLMLAMLVILPVSGAAIFIALFAKDTAEIASALVAGAAALFLASFFQIGLFFRDVRAIGERQMESRQHALALARCMKELTLRIAALEAGQAAPEAAAQIEPTRPAAPAPSAVPPLPQTLAPPAPPPAAPPAPPLAERRFLTLPQRRLAGIEIVTAPTIAADDPFLIGFQEIGSDGCMLEKIDAAARLIDSAMRPDSAFVLVAASAGLDQLPASVDRMLALAADDPEFAARFLLGLSQHSVRTGGAGQAQALARLARAGLCFILTEVRDTALDAKALRACNITHVRINGRALIDAALSTGSEMTALTARLATGGIAVIAEGIDDTRMIPELIDLAIPLAEGSAFSREQKPAMRTVVPLPARPAQTEADVPPLVARAEDSVRYRAAG